MRHLLSCGQNVLNRGEEHSTYIMEKSLLHSKDYSPLYDNDNRFQLEFQLFA